MTATTSLIPTVVTSFYAKATTDFLIGYHFRKIAEIEGINPLAPPIEAFAAHIPRIVSFWELQLIGKTSTPLTRPLQLFPVHKALNLRRGELGRWVLLFTQTLDEQAPNFPDQGSLIKKWREKIQSFEQDFLKSPLLFS
jgi:hypothetical protein